MARNAIESEFRTKVNFGHPKWPTAAIVSKILKTIKVSYWSEMAKHVIKSDFRTSKISAGGHFVKISKKNKKNYWSKMARNVIGSYSRPSKMGAGGHFVKKFKKKFRIELKWPKILSKVSFGHPKSHRQPVCKIFHKNKNNGIDLKW